VGSALDQDEAVAVMLEKYEVCCGLFHGFDWTKWTSGTPQERLGLLPAAQEHILRQENGKDRCLVAVRALSQAFVLARRIHDRMPVLLGRHDLDAWLTETGHMRRKSFGAGRKSNGSGRGDDDPSLIEPVEDEAIATG